MFKRVFMYILCFIFLENRNYYIIYKYKKGNDIILGSMIINLMFYRFSKINPTLYFYYQADIYN